MMKMKRTLRLAHTVSLLLALVSTGLVFAVGAKGKPPSDTPVTTTIDGLGVDTIPTLRIQAINLALTEIQVVTVHTASLSGDWVLDML